MSDFIVINKSDDSIIYEVAQLMRQRADKGKQTYGTTMDRDDLSTEQWLDHGIEEALDLAIYLTKVKRDLQELKALNMPDITMCKGEGCPVKEKCYRYTAKPNEYRQSYFVEVPYKDDECDYFWAENQEQIWNSLKDIVNGKDS